MFIKDKIEGLELKRKREATEERKAYMVELCFPCILLLVLTNSSLQLRKQIKKDSAIPDAERNNVYFVDPMK